jgi:hypothetical protein
MTAAKKPRMRTRAEIISALRHAGNRAAAEGAICAANAWGTTEHTEANVRQCMWLGEVRAYRFVLHVTGGDPDPIA